MSFELRFPAGGPYTASWTPSCDPIIEGSSVHEDDGVLVDEMADGVTQYQDGVCPPYEDYLYSFDTLEEADRMAFKAFRNAARGAAFDFKDATMLDYLEGQFAPDGVRREWRRRDVDRWAVNLKIRARSA